MSQHTPGPWEVASAARYEEGKLMEPVEYWVRQVGADVGVADMVDTPANARLIAAAPDMLAALKDLVAYVGMMPPKIVIDIALAVIAKAEGSK